jgi:hypothetical protein
MYRLLALFFIALSAATAALADKAAYLELARKGWVYELRTTMIGRDLSIPVSINGRNLSGASLCIVGDAPHPASLEVINSFRALVRHSFGKPLPMRYAGPDARGCGSGRTVVLRLFSGFPPNRALSRDLDWLNEVHLLGLPAGRIYAAQSPAMGQTFFGRRGQGTHIMVMQPAHGSPDQVEAAFYKSILIEELFQTFTFGMDILLFDRKSEFSSKLQEIPINLRRLPWNSHAFMRALSSANPQRLCPFDVFMLHAVAQAPVDQTLDPRFLDFIDVTFDQLMKQAADTIADARFSVIIDPSCARPTKG